MLDVGQEQILVEGVDLSYAALLSQWPVALACLGGVRRERFDQGRLRHSHIVLLADHLAVLAHLGSPGQLRLPCHHLQMLLMTGDLLEYLLVLILDAIILVLHLLVLLDQLVVFLVQ